MSSQVLDCSFRSSSRYAVCQRYSLDKKDCMGGSCMACNSLNIRLKDPVNLIKLSGCQSHVNVNRMTRMDVQERFL